MGMESSGNKVHKKQKKRKILRVCNTISNIYYYVLDVHGVLRQYYCWGIPSP